MLNPMRLLRCTCSLFCLCLLGLSACGTSSAPSTNGTPSASSCAPTGRTRVIRAAPLPAAQGEWPLFHGDLQRDGAAAAGGGSMLSLAWSYCTGAAVLSSPVVSAGVVYSASTNGTVAALDARSGRLRWQWHAGSALYSTPAVQNGTLFVGALDGFVSAVDAVSGQVRWRSSVDDPGAKIWSSPPGREWTGHRWRSLDVE